MNPIDAIHVLRGPSINASASGLRVAEAHCVPARETCLHYIADVILPG
jgi:hypothetical protein